MLTKTGDKHAFHASIYEVDVALRKSCSEVYLKMRNVLFSSTDFELFDTDLTPQDYEFFQKHKGAFKSLLEDQTQEQKQKFVSAFREFSINNGCIKDFPIKSDQLHVLGFVDHVIQHLKENFVNGKVSKAKCLVQDAVVLAQNRNLIHHVGSSSYAKDPFIHKDTRDVFRRLFGEPSEKDAALKAMCLFPLYVKFGGAVCRYLRRWLEAGKLDELGVTSLTQLPLSALQKSSSVSTSSESTQTTSTKENNSTAAVSQSTTKALPSSEPRPTTGPMVTVATIGRNGGLEILGSSDDDDNDNDDDEEEDSWETKVIRGIQSVLTDRAGPSAIDYMEVYKRHKDGSYRRLRDQLHLGKPHPNQEFEERCRKKEEEVIEGSQLHEVILKDYAESGKKKHACANCRQVERYAGTFKKCQRCKGKGTKFYCSRKCQGEDWVCRHRMQHSTVELPS